MSDRPTEQFPAIPGPGPAPTNPKRPSWLVMLVAALVTLAVSLPLGVYLLMRDTGGDQARPSAPTPSVPVPSPTSPGSGAGPSTSAGPSAPDGHISLATLREATLPVPAWPTDNLRGPSGRLTFHYGSVQVTPSAVGTGEAPYGVSVVILSATYGDVDHDGSDETIAEIGCLIEGGSKQLVAYDRDRAGHIVSLGRVAATTGPVRDIRTGSTRVTASGTVTALAGDYQACCDDQTPQLWQRRGYALRQGRFVQVSGPTRMTVNPSVTETRVTAGALVLGPATGGYRTGTIDVTIGQRWGAVPTRILLRFYPPAGLDRAGTGWPPVTAESNAFTVTVAAPPAGHSVTHTFAFQRAAALTGGELIVEASTIPQLSEAIPWNDAASAPIRTAN